MPRKIKAPVKVNLFPSVREVMDQIGLDIMDIAEIQAISVDNVKQRLNNYYKNYKASKLYSYLQIYKKFKISGKKGIDAMHVRDIIFKLISYDEKILSLYSKANTWVYPTKFIKIRYTYKVVWFREPKLLKNGIKVYTKTNPQYRLYCAIWHDIGEYCKVEHTKNQKQAVIKLDIEQYPDILEIKDIEGSVVENGMRIKPKYAPLMNFLNETSNFNKGDEPITIDKIGYKGLSPRYRSLWNEIKDMAIKYILYNHRPNTSLEVNRNRLTEISNEPRRFIGWEKPTIYKDHIKGLGLTFDIKGNAIDTAIWNEKPLDLCPNPNKMAQLASMGDPNWARREKQYDKTFVLRSKMHYLRQKIKPVKNDYILYEKLRKMHKKELFGKVKKSKRGISLWEQAREGLKTYYCLIPYRTIKLIVQNIPKSKHLEVLGKTNIPNPQKNIDLIRSGFKAVNGSNRYPIPAKKIILYEDEKSFFEYYNNYITEGFFTEPQKLDKNWNAYNLYWVRTNIGFKEFEKHGTVLMPKARKGSLNYKKPSISDMVRSNLDEPCTAFYPERHESDKVWDKEYQLVYDLRQELRSKIDSNASRNEKEKILKKIKAKSNSVRRFREYIPIQHVLELSPKFQRDDFVRAFNQFYSSLNTAKGLVFNDTGANLTGKSRIRVNSSLKRMKYKEENAIFSYLSKLPMRAKINFDGKVFRPNSTHNYRQIIESGLIRFLNLFNCKKILQINRYLEGDLYYCLTQLEADYIRMLEIYSKREKLAVIRELLWIFNRHNCLVKCMKFGYFITDKDNSEIVRVAHKLKGDLIFEIFDQNALNSLKNKDKEIMDEMEFEDKWTAIEAHFNKLVKDITPNKEVADNIGREKPLKVVSYIYWEDLPKGRFSNKVEQFRTFRGLRFRKSGDMTYTYIEVGKEYNDIVPELKELKVSFDLGMKIYYIDSDQSIQKAKIVKLNTRTVQLDNDIIPYYCNVFNTKKQIEYVRDIALNSFYVNNLRVLLNEVREILEPLFKIKATARQMNLFERSDIMLKKRISRRVAGDIDLRNGVIRINPLVAELHPTVVKFVIFHELLHILEGDHNKSFREMEQLYPFYELSERVVGCKLANYE